MIEVSKQKKKNLQPKKQNAADCVNSPRPHGNFPGVDSPRGERVWTLQSREVGENWKTGAKRREILCCALQVPLFPLPFCLWAVFKFIVIPSYLPSIHPYTRKTEPVVIVVVVAVIVAFLAAVVVVPFLQG